MQLRHVEYTFTLLTPCFSGTALGKYDDHAEMRIPPIRGHVRFWHRELFGHESANQVWGSTNGDRGHGSRVALRLLEGEVNGSEPAHILPHDLKKSGKPRPSMAKGQSFTIQLQRLVGCQNDDWGKAQAAIRLWLVAGTLGYRSNRAAGSVWADADWSPRTTEDLAVALRALLRDARFPWCAAIITQSDSVGPELLRKAASNTPKGPTEIFGSANPRKPSPTRFKVIRLTSGFSLLVLARSQQVLQKAQQFIEGKSDRQGWNELGPWKIITP